MPRVSSFIEKYLCHNEIINLCHNEIININLQYNKKITRKLTSSKHDYQNIKCTQ